MPTATRAPKVTLAVRIHLASGKRRYSNPVFASNGRLKPQYAIVDGNSVHHPEAVYALRYKGVNGTRSGRPSDLIR